MIEQTKSAAAERQRRRRERRRRGERIAPTPYDDALLEALIECDLLAAWDADDPIEIGQAIFRAARNEVINRCPLLGEQRTSADRP